MISNYFCKKKLFKQDNNKTVFCAYATYYSWNYIRQKQSKILFSGDFLSCLTNFFMQKVLFPYFENNLAIKCSSST